MHTDRARGGELCPCEITPVPRQLKSHLSLLLLLLLLLFELEFNKKIPSRSCSALPKDGLIYQCRVPRVQDTAGRAAPRAAATDLPQLRLIDHRSISVTAEPIASVLETQGR
jgi:hypothetical protein